VADPTVPPVAGAVLVPVVVVPSGLMSGPTTYCWSCYARLDGDQAEVCPVCGGPVQPPQGTGFADLLLWALHHPLVGRRIAAAAALARRRELRAVEPLTVMATDPDPHLAAAAVHALAAFGGPEVDELLDRLGQVGPAPVRHAVHQVRPPGEPGAPTG